MSAMSPVPVSPQQHLNLHQQPQQLHQQPQQLSLSSSAASSSPRHGPSSFHTNPAVDPASPLDLSIFGMPSLEQHHPNQQQQQQQHHQPFPDFDDNEDGDDGDEHTEPSSTAAQSHANGPEYETVSTFGRILHSTRKRLSSAGGNPTANDRGSYQRDTAYSIDDDDFQESSGALICGHLQKLGRNGKWQTRWFESDGQCLAYYKSDRRLRQLATLDLAKVGSIVVNSADPSGVSFTVRISGRPYELRADSRSACRDWVIMLNRIKEARLQEGNVKLSRHRSMPTDGDAPRVVVVANRQRTRKVVDDDSWCDSGMEDMSVEDDHMDGYGTHAGLARWRKSGGRLSRTGDRMLRWAKSLQELNCASSDESIFPDQRVRTSSAGYIGKSKAYGSPMPFQSDMHQPQTIANNADDTMHELS